MALFHIVRTTPLSPDEAWRRLTDWERHGQVMPLTRVTVSGAAGGAGALLTARSGVGPLAFDDLMEVVVWQPPQGRRGACRLVKRGSFVTGWAEIEVGPDGVGGGSRVVWREELRVRWLPKVLDPVVARSASWLFGRAVDALLAGR
ncbi:SRPBCC family protein [Streptomyces sp. NRRL B-1347]|uniref:SRPBCC family protein n=1 Tax=Streptomyces sp. NRRL B-1347 TaxID=1476877 RepID=UPI0004C54316|nr:SRPBCC family protein [Streptomyces sp. NRRL B-1347]